MGIDPLRVEDRNVYFSPVVETVSSFKPSRYQSLLMPNENKPLEVGILRRVKELLAEVDPKTAAKHITKADCMVQFKAAVINIFRLTIAKMVAENYQIAPVLAHDFTALIQCSLTLSFSNAN